MLIRCRSEGPMTCHGVSGLLGSTGMVGHVHRGSMSLPDVRLLKSIRSSTMGVMLLEEPSALAKGAPRG